jgi:hypothetical protein
MWSSYNPLNLFSQSSESGEQCVSHVDDAEKGLQADLENSESSDLQRLFQSFLENHQRALELLASLEV